MATKANNPEKAPEKVAAETPAESPTLEGKAQVAAGMESEGTPEPSSTAPLKDEGQAEELIAGKFKSQDDLVNAYQNLEKKLGEQGNELAELRQTLMPQESELDEGKPPQPVQQTTDASVSPDELFTLNEMIDSRATEIVDAKLDAKLRPLQVEQEINEVKNTPDFKQLLPDVKDIYNKNPQLRQPGNLKLVLDMARGQQADKMAKKLKEEGKNEALAQIEKKQKAIVEGASKARGNTSELTKEIAVEMSAKELEEMLPHENR